MRRIDPNSPAIRKHVEVRGPPSDNTLGYYPRSVPYGADGPVFVAWLLDSLRESFADDLLYDEHVPFARAEFSAPAALQAIARATEDVDRQISDLLEWTALRFDVHGCRKREGVLVRMVPYVWGHIEERFEPFIRTVVERWPADVDPREATYERPPPRVFKQPVEGPCRFPDIAVGITAVGAASRVQCATPLTDRRIVNAVAFALREGGAPDAETVDFIDSMDDYDPLEAATRFVMLDGAPLSPERFDALADLLELPQSVLERFPFPERPRLVLVDQSELVPIDDAVYREVHSSHHITETCEFDAAPEPIDEQIAQVAQYEPEVVLIAASDLTPERAERLARILPPASVLFVGHGPGIEHATQAFAPLGVKAHDFRKGLKISR